MNTLTILKSKPHNPHYLNKYYSFILRCIEKNQNETCYMENHHICPKSKDMFPEYSCLKTNPWNSSKLTYRQHVIAHIMLYKTYNTISQLLSILYTSGQNNVSTLNLKTINTKLIESLKKDLSNRRKGRYYNTLCFKC